MATKVLFAVVVEVEDDDLDVVFRVGKQIERGVKFVRDEYRNLDGDKFEICEILTREFKDGEVLI